MTTHRLILYQNLNKYRSDNQNMEILLTQLDKEGKGRGQNPFLIIAIIKTIILQMLNPCLRLHFPAIIIRLY